jgi:uncharacterized protein
MAVHGQIGSQWPSTTLQTEPASGVISEPWPEALHRPSIRRWTHTILIVASHLPTFRYHPDPVETGAVVASAETCEVCDKVRGYHYVGPTFSAEADEPVICPWCIADGSAARLLDAEFTDVGADVPGEVSAAVIAEIATRTPGFAGWQQEHWMYHCGDGTAFLGPVGRRALDGLDDALNSLLHEHDAYHWTAQESSDYVESLDRDDQPRAYLFRCLACGTHLAYSDFT